MAFAKPCPCRREPGVDRNFCLPAQVAMRPAGVEAHAPNLELAGGQKLGLRVPAGLFEQALDDCVDSGLAPGPDVHHARDATEHCSHVGGRHIAYVDEIACLPAVPINAQGGALEHPVAGDRDDARVARAVLAWTVDVAVAQRERRDPVPQPERGHVDLLRSLGRTVRGERVRLVDLPGGQLRTLAVDSATRRCHHHTARAGLDRRVEEAHRAGEAGLYMLTWITGRSLDAALGGEV